MNGYQNFVHHSGAPALRACTRLLLQSVLCYECSGRPKSLRDLLPAPSELFLGTGEQLGKPGCSEAWGG